MNKGKIIFILGICIIIIVLVTGCSMENKKQIEKEIIGKEKLFLDEWGKGHTMIFPNNGADEITYFDPGLGKRIDGIGEYSKYLKSFENTFTIEKYEMLDPKVQVHGDIAVLTYNLIDYSKDSLGTTKRTFWNTTEVYKRINDEWKIIHTHWSYTKPELK